MRVMEEIVQRDSLTLVSSPVIKEEIKNFGQSLLEMIERHVII